jgi:hypothetical protein
MRTYRMRADLFPWVYNIVHVTYMYNLQNVQPHGRLSEDSQRVRM